MEKTVTGPDTGGGDMGSVAKFIEGVHNGGEVRRVKLSNGKYQHQVKVRGKWIRGKANKVKWGA